MQNALNIEQSNDELLQRRQHRRVAVRLEGRFMLSDRSEHRCTTRNVSPGGLEIVAAVKPLANETIIAYIEVLGRVEGKAVRVTPAGFALKCNPSDLKRDKLATQLTWLINKEALDLEDQRRSDRIVTDGKAHATIEFDGLHRPAEIVDFSLKGVAFTCNARLAVGQAILLNQKPCVIVRLFDGGYGAAFVNGASM